MSLPPVSPPWRAAALLVCGLSLPSCSGARVEGLPEERAPSVFGTPSSAEKPKGAYSPVTQRAAAPVPEDLAGYVALACDQSPELRAAFAAWKSSLARIPQAGALPDPVLSFAHFVEEIQTRTGPQRNRIGLTQSFPWFGTLGAMEDAARKEAEAAWQRVLATKLRIEARVRKSWFAYGFLRERLRIAEAQLDLLKQLEPVVTRRIETGAPASDLIQLQLEIDRLASEVDALRDERQPRSRALERAASIDRVNPLPWPKLAAPEFYEVESAGLLRRIGQQNPELRALAQRIAAGEERVRAAQKSGYPKFSVGVDWFDTGPALMPNTPGSGDDPWLVRVGVSLPIWRGKYDGAETEAKSELERRGYEFAAKRDELRLRIAERLFALRDARRRAELAQDTLIPRAREAQRLITTDYEGGRKSLNDLIASERVLLAMETDYWRAVQEWFSNEAELRALVGGEVR